MPRKIIQELRISKYSDKLKQIYFMVKPLTDKGFTTFIRRNSNGEFFITRDSAEVNMSKELVVWMQDEKEDPQFKNSTRYDNKEIRTTLERESYKGEI